MEDEKQAREKAFMFAFVAWTWSWLADVGRRIGRTSRADRRLLHIGKCDNCVFWTRRSRRALYDGGNGECHFYPPVPAPNRFSGEVLWPMTSSSDWCGEWRPKPPSRGARPAR